MPQISDDELIQSVLKGNHSDFTLLVTRYKGKMFSLIRKIVKNNMDAEEIMVDVFMKAFHNLASFRRDAKFSTWLYRIAYNTSVSFLGSKKKKKENLTVSLAEDFEVADIFVNKTENEDNASLLWRVVAALPPKQAAVISLFYRDRLECEEIADIMSLSKENVKVILFRTRKELKEILVKNQLVDELL